MGDRWKIGLGLVVFFALAAYPVWSAMASPADPAQPELERSVDPSGCVEDTLFMRASHQQLLNEWRTLVVRDGQRTWTSSTGREWEMSLTGTCLKCHTNSETFCTRCHDYADVHPTCWSCHVVPEGEGQGGTS
ncbi:MAG: sulfate reduction electron transfer complex DsrMKJOP subunit DsrJ [Gemmatimonadota bacterium]|jgi:hypothetical protein